MGRGSPFSWSWAHDRLEGYLMDKLNIFDYRAARIAAGLELAEVARAIGYGEAMMSRIERGQRELPEEREHRLRDFLAAALRRKAEQAASLAKTLSAA